MELAGGRLVVRDGTDAVDVQVIGVAVTYRPRHKLVGIFRSPRPRSLSAKTRPPLSQRVIL